MKALWRCRNCGYRVDASWVHVRCPRCLGPLDRLHPIRFDPEQEAADAPGLWRYRHTFAVAEANLRLPTPDVGPTPLQQVHAAGHTLYFKREDRLPTGSVKDRAAAVLLAWAAGQGLNQVAVPATPNTLRAWLAFGRRLGVDLQAYGPPEVLRAFHGRVEAIAVPGPPQAAKEVLLRRDPAVLPPYHPLAVDAYATIAYELVAQLGDAPGTVVAAVGEGTLLLGLGRGFVALWQQGLLPQVPRLVGVEPLPRAALWARARGGREAHLWIRDEAPAPSLETGRRFPWWGDLLLPLVAWSQGAFVAVDEESVARARDILQHRGLYLQPEAAMLWAAWAEHREAWPEPVVLVISGGARVGWRQRLRGYWQQLRQRMTQRSSRPGTGRP